MITLFNYFLLRVSLRNAKSYWIKQQVVQEHKQTIIFCIMLDFLLFVFIILQTILQLKTF